MSNDEHSRLRAQDTVHQLLPHHPSPAPDLSRTLAVLVAGQVHGGIAQGIAQALYEEVVYDDSGQLLTATLMDYAVPRAEMLPRYELDHTVTPSPLNPMGAKGVGEAGTIGSTPCIVNAVMDALAPLGVRHLDMPLRPGKLWHAIRDAGKA